LVTHQGGQPIELLENHGRPRAPVPADSCAAAPSRPGLRQIRPWRVGEAIDHSQQSRPAGPERPIKPTNRLAAIENERIVDRGLEPNRHVKPSTTSSNAPDTNLDHRYRLDSTVV